MTVDNFTQPETKVQKNDREAWKTKWTTEKQIRIHQRQPGERVEIQEKRNEKKIWYKIVWQEVVVNSAPMHLHTLYNSYHEYYCVAPTCREQQTDISVRWIFTVKQTQ